MAGSGSCEENLQTVHSNWFGSIQLGIKNEKKERSSTCPHDRVHPLALPYIDKAPTNVNIYILNLGLKIKLIERYMILNLE